MVRRQEGEKPRSGGGEQRRTLILKNVIDLVTYKPKRGGGNESNEEQLKGRCSMEWGRAEKESHEGGKADTKHGFIKGSGRVWQGKQKRQRKESSGGRCGERGNERINAGEQRRGEGKNRDG